MNSAPPLAKPVDAARAEGAAVEAGVVSEVLDVALSWTPASTP